MSLRTPILGCIVALALLVPCASAVAKPAPAWQLRLSANPTNFTPGATVAHEYTIYATNVGGEATSGTYTLTDTLPAGITPVAAGFNYSNLDCPITGQTVTCSSSNVVEASGLIEVHIQVHVAAGLQEGSVLEDEVSISGGGTASPAADSTQTTIASAPAPFGFSDLMAGAFDEEGLPEEAAGSHPASVLIDVGFPTINTGELALGTDGGVRDSHINLPAGMVLNPAATPVRCTEVQLEALSCPDASQVGTFNTAYGLGPYLTSSPDGLFNMVAPPGTAAELGTAAAGGVIYVHLKGGVRAGSYVLGADVNDIAALSGKPVLGTHVLLWGDPSASIHDHLRGRCAFGLAPSCPVAARETALLSMPTACTGALQVTAEADSWRHPADFVKTSSPLTDALGSPTGVKECAALAAGFKPTLEARPTTNQGDSPSGLSANLHIPQHDNLGELATAHLRKAVVTLPPGLTLNPASANGLEGCSSAQIGIDPETGARNGNQPTCPSASRIGTAEVVTPLLDHALPGSVYVASSYDNPFHSLLAIYAVINDPLSGTLIKLPAHVEADPNTGQLTTTFDNNPQLPFSDFKLDFFGGPGGVLRTPSVCGRYATTSAMTPWSAPESGPPATTRDEYAISGNCSQSEGTRPNSPSFDAGTVAPIAAKYTPFVIHLRREDGSQEFSQITVTPPPGLIAKLAGVPYCSEADLAAAGVKTGHQEQQSPSCPQASRIGTVNVAAGSGPAPYWVGANAYLAGPYKGAPLSMAIVTPAAAGPYDLGTVVTRVALRVNPETTQVTADADPIPHILAGIPLDVRQVNVSIDRGEFIRTGTSCDPLSIKGQLVSTLGQSASLSNPFQLANCTNLRFQPKLSLRLIGKTARGSHPALKATLTMPEANANIAKASVGLPHSEFLDQSHIGTVCTRVQYAAGAGGGSQCPPASVYGSATAWSPLLGQPLSGPVYLRSSSHQLPDLVASLGGQIHVDLDGRIDSVRGGIRTSFEVVPDAPVSKFVLSMPGAGKGLLQNSTNICKGTHNARASFDAQNGAVADLSVPVVNAKCPKPKSHKRRRSAR